MNDISSRMGEEYQGVEQLKPGRYDNEHVDSDSVMHVISQERAPGRGGELGPPRQVSADRGLADLDAEFEQLAVDAGERPKADSPGSSGGSDHGPRGSCWAVPGDVPAAASRGGSVCDASRSRRLPGLSWTPQARVVFG